MKFNLFLGITSPTTVDRKMKAPTIPAVAAISSNKAVGASPTVARSAARAMCQRATMTIISITCTRIGESDKCNSSSANHLHHRRCAHSSDNEAAVINQHAGRVLADRLALVSSSVRCRMSIERSKQQHNNITMATMRRRIVRWWKDAVPGSKFD